MVQARDPGIYAQILEDVRPLPPTVYVFACLLTIFPHYVVASCVTFTP